MRDRPRPGWVAYLGCYALFLVVIALALLALDIWRLVLPDIGARFLSNGYVLSGLYAPAVVVLGVALFIVVMASEPYLRMGLEKQRLLHRFGRVAVPLFVVVVAGFVCRFLFPPIG
jgi:hypothetical protein